MGVAGGGVAWRGGVDMVSAGGCEPEISEVVNGLIITKGGG